MRILKLKKISLAICLTFIPLTTYAAGLGKLNVISGLGEPFRAEIDLISTTPDELETLSAVIASKDAYASQGITRLGIHNDMKISIANSATGTPKLLLRSNRVVSDPYIDMLIQLDWASGRLQREYTVLLDPPGYKDRITANQAAPISIPTVAAKAVPATLAVPNARMAQFEELPASAQQIRNAVPTLLPGTSSIEVPAVRRANPVATQSVDQGGYGAVIGKSEAEIEAEIKRIEAQAKSQATYIDESTYNYNPVVEAQPRRAAVRRLDKKTTISGDTLSGIAARMRIPGVSLNQMLVGLYEYNKDAFVGGNMNRLKVGRVIKLPPKSDLQAVSRSQANETVVLHTDNWRGYRNALASSIQESNNVDDESKKQVETGVIAAVEPKKQVVEEKAKDVVKLSAGEQAKIDKDAELAAIEKKNADQEDKIASEKALAEAKDRTDAVEKQIQDMEKLLAMKNKAMVDLQNNAADENASDDVETAEESVERVIAETQQQVKDAEEKAASMIDLSGDEEVVEASTEPDAVVPPPEDVADQPSFFAGLKDMVNLPILGALGSIALLLGGWLFLRNKRRKDLESFERGILTSGGLRANTVFGNTTGNTSTTDTSFLTDFAQSTDGTMMDANEVDPIAEAEVYMAYGREEQAEEILKEAIKKEPQRNELHIKLLEIYADRKDTSAFETVAGELYTTLGDDDPDWLKVAEMGRGIEPENPLYDNGTVVNESKPDSVATPVVAAAADVTAPVVEKVAENNDLPVLDTIVNPLADKVDDVSDAVTEKSSGFAAKAAAITGVAAAAVASGGSRIESIVRHKPVQAATEAMADVKDNVSDKIDSLNIDESLDSFDAKLDEIDLSLTKDTISEPGIELADIDESNADMNIEMTTQEPVAEADDLKSFDLSGISLDLEDGQAANVDQVEEITLDTAATETPDFTELTLESDDGDVEEISMDAGAGEDEVEIKLNLVAAYIDMEDKEGALELLDEVLKEGSDEQVMKAQMMKDSMA